MKHSVVILRIKVLPHWCIARAPRLAIVPDRNRPQTYTFPMLSYFSSSSVIAGPSHLCSSKSSPGLQVQYAAQDTHGTSARRRTPWHTPCRHAVHVISCYSHRITLTVLLTVMTALSQALKAASAATYFALLQAIPIESGRMEGSDLLASNSRAA